MGTLRSSAGFGTGQFSKQGSRLPGSDVRSTEILAPFVAKEESGHIMTRYTFH
jgi:hypothetical protein